MTKIDGRKAEIINAGQWYNTYTGFAVKHGYPDAAHGYDRSADLRKEPEDGDYVTLLVSGGHKTDGNTLWIVETSNGERHIIGEKGLRILDEKVTVLKDELGLQREYREVKRKARVGERVKYIWPGCNSHIDVVTKVKDDGSVKIPAYVDENGDECVGYALRAYVVLEKSDIVHVNGERFREVNRKANVGERVAVVNDSSVTLLGRSRYYRAGNVAIVLNTGGVDIYADLTCNEKFYEDGRWYVRHKDYRVLEPLTPAQQSQASEQSNTSELERKSREQQAQINGLTETVANLARRLSEAEIQLRVAREDIVLIEDGVSEELRKLETKVEELQRTSDTTESNLVDLASRQRDHLVRLNRIGEKVEKVNACGAEYTPPYKPLTRDEIIEKAKADVAKLAERARTGLDTPLTKHVGHVDIRFEVNREKKTVVALAGLRYCGGHVVARGIAKCAPNDCFNVYIGMAIALRRALGLDIPSEYVNAPQPTEVRVGDVVRYDQHPVTVISDVGHDSINVSKHTFLSTASGLSPSILDDSRDGRYGEVYSV